MIAGAIRPSSSEIAMPTLMSACSRIASSANEALTCGWSTSARAQAAVNTSE